MKWDAERYENKHDFVAQYGKSLISYLPDTISKLNVLDLGCGTGTLTNELAKRANTVVGVDASPDMIEKARELYPHIKFSVENAINLPYEGDFDIVFSNAVFHWIPDQERLLANIHQVLRPGGLLIAEFGGQGNIRRLESAFQKTLEQYGYNYISPFCFPAAPTYGELLGQSGFQVEYCNRYTRPTPLNAGSNGLREWVTQFFWLDLKNFQEEQRLEILAQMEDRLRPTLWNSRKSQWIADYVRLRIVAKKPNIV